MSQQIISLIKAAIPDSQVMISGEGCGYQATVISASFENLNQVKRQQQIYQAIQGLITSGELHAISLRAYTPTQWSELHG